MNRPKRIGRPPLPEQDRKAPDPVRTIRLSNELWEKLQRLGGVSWLRERIRRAKDASR